MTDIMLVDDEVLALEYLKNMVDWERNGYHVVGCATSGKKALELFDRTHPQIVISDIRMPGTDGLELTRQIKEKDKETVVILLSAYRDFDYAQKGIRYGVSNYLLKHELSSELILKELEEVKEKLERACEGETNAYGRFLHFDYLTMVPFDLDAVDTRYLNEDDKKLLNAYHAKVRETILPYLAGDEAEWLLHATREI